MIRLPTKKKPDLIYPKIFRKKFPTLGTTHDKRNANNKPPKTVPIIVFLIEWSGFRGIL